MLTPRIHRRQRGVVLLMAIIVLVALTIGALALTRSIYTANVVAGNLAFQRAATHSAELGMEKAVGWLETKAAIAAASSGACPQPLQCKQDGYLANRSADNAKHANWLDYWDKALAANSVNAGELGGNTVRYAIQRMCMQDGDPMDTNNGCIVSPRQPTNNQAGIRKPLEPSPVYYRITVSVEGPRNTRSLVQAMVSL